LAVASSAAERSLFGEIKVLVAADEYRVRKVIHGLLLASGCTKIHEAPNGGEALESIASLAPDVVLLDWMLPDMNGPEFLRRLHLTVPAQIANVPVIMMAGHDQRAYVRLGVHEFLLKPVSITSLQERLASILDKSITLRRAQQATRQARKLAS
jgi:CheY-like chemotaxis protein